MNLFIMVETWVHAMCPSLNSFFVFMVTQKQRDWEDFFHFWSIPAKTRTGEERKWSYQLQMSPDQFTSYIAVIGIANYRFVVLERYCIQGGQRRPWETPEEGLAPLFEERLHDIVDVLQAMEHGLNSSVDIHEPIQEWKDEVYLQ